MEKETIEQMRKLLEVQGQSGNWNYDPYMHGMFNGMELMVATAEGREPVFKEAPDVWLKDIKVEPKPIHAAEIQPALEEKPVLAKHVYNGWAFKENSDEKATINRIIYDELHAKYKIYRDDMNSIPNVNTNDYDVVIGREPAYLHSKYYVHKNAPGLSHNELLLLCDRGNLCFGGSCIGDNVYRVNED